MKCIKKKDEAKRMNNEEAADLVKNKGWKYVPKSSWKSSSEAKVADPE